MSVLCISHLLMSLNQNSVSRCYVIKIKLLVTCCKSAFICSAVQRTTFNIVEIIVHK